MTSRMPRSRARWAFSSPRASTMPNPARTARGGIILVGQGVAEVDQQAIAQILGDVSVIAGDHLGAGVLIGPHHLAPLFGVELAGEHRRVHQVTEQDGELAAFGLWRSRLSSLLG